MFFSSVPIPGTIVTFIAINETIKKNLKNQQRLTHHVCQVYGNSFMMVVYRYNQWCSVTRDGSTGIQQVREDERIGDDGKKRTGIARNGRTGRDRHKHRTGVGLARSRQFSCSRGTGPNGWNSEGW